MVAAQAGVYPAFGGDAPAPISGMPRAQSATAKIVAIYSAQILLGMVVLTFGYAKFAGWDFMVQHFTVLGVGHNLLMIAGGVEIIAGLCLLLPRGGIVGALLIACVATGMLGVTVGHLASTTQPSSMQMTISDHQLDFGRPPVGRSKAGWDI